MGRFIDMKGKKFGRLLVIRQAESTQHGVKWECLCTCGKTITVQGSNLRNGHTKSCGCYHTDIVKETGATMGKANKKHGMSYDRLHHIWAGMKQRCENPKSTDYSNYGERGITVCDEWRDSFEIFRDWAIANGYRANLTLDRKDNNGPYSPENCRWSDAIEQGNNKRNNSSLTFNGRTQTIAQWAKETGISWGTIAARLRSGWTVERALTEKIHTK